jgi:hypothetical protein
LRDSFSRFWPKSRTGRPSRQRSAGICSLSETKPGGFLEKGKEYIDLYPDLVPAWLNASDFAADFQDVQNTTAVKNLSDRGSQNTFRGYCNRHRGSHNRHRGYYNRLRGFQNTLRKSLASSIKKMRRVTIPALASFPKWNKAALYMGLPVWRFP